MSLLERERVLLGTLLHDIEKIYQYTGLSEPCEIPLPEPFREIFSISPEHIERFSERLTPVAQYISLKPAHTSPRVQTIQYQYPIKPISWQYEDFMPKTAGEFEDNPVWEYQELWRNFIEEMRQLRHQKDFDAYFFTLYFLLKKYFSRVPSAKELDTSFFDHARVTSAIEDCRYLYKKEKEERNQTVTENPEAFLLIEGGISGIQNFMYNMISPQQEHARLVQRLRGRSFYLLLLVETIVDYLFQELELKIVHQIWCNSGHFLIIAPNTPSVTYHLKACYRDINAFLLNSFRGELALVLTSLVVSEEVFEKDFDSASQQLSNQLEREKTRKFADVLREEQDFQFPFLPSAKNIDYAVPVDDYVQCLNETQEDIGIKLTKFNTGYTRLVKCYLPDSALLPSELLAYFRIGGKHISWGIKQAHYEQVDTVYLLNDPTEKFWGSGRIKYGFKFIATYVDTYETQAEVNRHHQEYPDESPVKVGDIKHFTDIAKAGKGEFLGILRMDVDRLETIFRFGLGKSSILQIASLSSDIDLFLTGYFPRLCQTRFRKNVYISYAGGDDFLVIGAWDQMVELACQVRKDFQIFTCKNPDIHISGGIFLCKEKYPIHLAAQQAGELLDSMAKENEQQEKNLQGEVRCHDAFAIFNHRISWDEFLDMKQAAELFVEAINTSRLRRGFLYNMLNLHKTWGVSRTLNIARLYYVTARKVQDRILRTMMLEKLSRHEYLSNQSYLPLLVGYAELKTRARKEDGQHAR